MAVKTSILVFYLTLTRGEKIFRWANYATLFVVNAAGLALTLVNVFQCTPVGAAFHFSLAPNEHCTDIVTLYLSSSPVNIVTDLAILFLPMPILTQMRLPRKQKIILVITFSFGFFVAIVDVIRIAYLQSAATSRQLDLQSIHFQNDGADDFTCMPPPPPPPLPRFLNVVPTLAWSVLPFLSPANMYIFSSSKQGMPPCLSCGRLSKSTYRLFALACPVSNPLWLALFQR